MMGLNTMREINRQAAVRAAQQKKRPYLLQDDDGYRMLQGRSFPFPHLGYWMPDGYTMTRVFFVDASGFGADCEPAYSIRQFTEKLVPGRYYAVVETGQFQVHVAEFVREGHEPDEVDLSGRATYPPEGILSEMDWCEGEEA